MGIKTEKKPWMIGPRTNSYACVGSSMEERLALARLGKLNFEALSISGFDGKQACLVPLDESSRGTAELIVRAINEGPLLPEQPTATMLLAVSSILDAHAAKLVWQRMRRAALGAGLG